MLHYNQVPNDVHSFLIYTFISTTSNTFGSHRKQIECTRHRNIAKCVVDANDKWLFYIIQCALELMRPHSDRAYLM